MIWVEDARKAQAQVFGREGGSRPQRAAHVEALLGTLLALESAKGTSPCSVLVFANTKDGSSASAPRFPACPH